MPATWTISQGTPSDAVGAQGDLNFDSQGRFIWGPKGATSWAGTANNVTVTQNASMLTGQSMAPTQFAATNNITLTATQTTMTLPGIPVGYNYVPLAPSSFMGFYAYTNVAATVRLFDQTAGVVIYTKALSAGANTVVGPFAANTYPMTPGNVHIWQVTGSASGATISLQPWYLAPANSPGLCVGQGPMSGFSSSQTFNATAVNVPLFGTAAGSTIGLHVPLRTAGVYSAIATYTPAAGTPSTASIKPVLAFAPLGSGSGGNVALNFASVTATGQPQVLLPPQITDVSSLSTANFYYWTVTGSGTGTLQIQLIPLV